MISVVMPVRNEGRLVGRAIRSILEQTYRDFEFIIVDNASTDDTREVIARFAAQDPRIRILHEPREGPQHARNRGMAEARHRWVAAQDADDVSHPRRFEWQLAHLARHPRTIVLGSWAIVYSERTGIREPFHHETTDFGIRCQLRTGPSPFVQSSVILSREAFERVGGYPADFSRAEDYALWCLMRGEGRLQNLPMHLLVYRHQERDPNSAFRREEHAQTPEVRRRYLRPARPWDEWVLRATEPFRRRRALARMRVDWPDDLVRRYGLESSFRRGPIPVQPPAERVGAPRS